MSLCVFLFHLYSTGTPSSGPAAIGTPSIDSPCRNWSESFKQGRKQRMGGLFSGCLNHWKLRNTCGKQDTEKHTIMQCCEEQVEKMIRHFYPTPHPNLHCNDCCKQQHPEDLHFSMFSIWKEGLTTACMWAEWMFVFLWGSAMNWNLAQGVARPSDNDSWDRLQQTHATLECRMDGWMHGQTDGGTGNVNKKKWHSIFYRNRDRGQSVSSS